MLVNRSIRFVKTVEDILSILDILLSGVQLQNFQSLLQGLDLLVTLGGAILIGLNVRAALLVQSGLGPKIKRKFMKKTNRAQNGKKKISTR